MPRPLPSFPFLLPIATVKALDDCGVVDSPTFLSSSARNADAALAGLSAEERNLLDSVLNGTARPSPRVAQALAQSFPYLFPRESSPERRRILFKAVAAAPENSMDQRLPILTPPNPLEGRRGTFVALGLNSSGRALHFLVRPALRDIHTTRADGLDTAFLDLAAIDVRIDSAGAELRRLSLVTLDTSTQGTSVQSSFVRFLDLSYRDRSLDEVFTARDVGIRFGPGVTIGNGHLASTAVAYAGVMRFDAGERHGTAGDFGLRLSIFARAGTFTRIRTTFIRPIHTVFAFDSQVVTELVAFEIDRLVIGGSSTVSLSGQTPIGREAALELGWGF